MTSVIEQQNDRPDKRIYSITGTGKAAFTEWITNFPEKLSKESRDEFTLRIFFGSNLTKEELITQFQNFIKEKQGQMEKIRGLHQISEKYVEEMELFNGEQIYWRFVLRRAYLSIEMLIQWAKECLEELVKQG